MKKNKVTVSVVVLNWNGKDVTPRCIQSLLNQTHTVDEILVIDNGSTDGSAELIEKKFGNKIRMLKQDTNLGFAGGVNVGIKQSKSDYVMLLNSDAECERDCIEKMLATAKVHRADIVQATILTNNGKNIDSVGDIYSIWGLPHPGMRDEPSSHRPQSDIPIFAAAGGASMYHKSVFEEIGLFDEMFFAYYEDVDMSMRAQLRGKKIWLSSHGVVQHLMNYSFNKRPGMGRELTIRNSIYLFWKNLPFPLICRVFPKFLYANWRMTAAAVIKGHPIRAIRAQVTALIHTPQLLLRRHYIQTHKVLSSYDFETLLSHEKPFRPKKSITHE